MRPGASSVRHVLRAWLVLALLCVGAVPPGAARGLSERDARPAAAASSHHETALRPSAGETAVATRHRDRDPAAAGAGSIVLPARARASARPQGPGPVAGARHAPLGAVRAVPAIRGPPSERRV